MASRRIAALTILALLTMPALALEPAQKKVLETFQAAAPGDAARGKALFLGTHTGGKPETPSCTSCHTTDLKGEGRTRAGKAIAPMAASVNPKRYTDAADVEKWLKRNCGDVLGRECSAAEKSDILTFLTAQ